MATDPDRAGAVNQYEGASHAYVVEREKVQALEAELLKWKTCAQCGAPLEEPGATCSKANLEVTDGWMQEIEKERAAHAETKAQVQALEAERGV